MNTPKFFISSRLSGSLILSAAMFLGFGEPRPLSAQTSETSPTASAPSEPSPQSKTKDGGKAKYATGSYSVDQVPEHVSAAKHVSATANSDVVKSLQEKIRRLEDENAQLRAEIARLNAKD
jgi:hypothetical protein